MSKNKAYTTVTGFDGSNIRVMFSGLKLTSHNRKTGAMVQQVITPLDWTNKAQSGDKFDVMESTAVCGNCPLMRPDLNSEGNTCYVKQGTARMGLVSSAKSATGRQFISVDDILADIEGKPLRFGAFGEPVLMGEECTGKLAAAASNWTGYTHQWRDPAYSWAKQYFMASVHSADEASEARAAGWRTYRTVSSYDEADRADEVPCPYEKGIQCADCSLCSGTSISRRDGRPAKSIVSKLL